MGLVLGESIRISPRKGRLVGEDSSSPWAGTIQLAENYERTK